MDWIFASRSIERILIVLAGMLCIYLGYLLFVKGVSGKASLRAEFDRSKLQLANAMPGTFFSLFGAVVLVFAMRQPVVLDAAIPAGSKPGATTAASGPSSLPRPSEDVESIERVLKSYGFKDVEVLKPGDESRRRLLENPREEKYFIVYFAGHGALETDEIKSPNLNTAKAASQ